MSVQASPFSVSSILTLAATSNKVDHTVIRVTTDRQMKEDLRAAMSKLDLSQVERKAHQDAIDETIAVAFARAREFFSATAG